MRFTLAAALAATLATSPVLAQTDTAPPPAPAVHHHHHQRTHAVRTSGEKPVDVGPNTPEANGAYQGGGVSLQGAPGAPAPTPQATPPGQAPAGSVPP